MSQGQDESRVFRINKGIIFCIAHGERVHFNPCYKSEATCFDCGNLAIVKRADKVGHQASAARRPPLRREAELPAPQLLAT